MHNHNICKDQGFKPRTPQEKREGNKNKNQRLKCFDKRHDGLL
jgi:hypothetical protein